MDEFVDYLREVFELFGPIRARKMFSGYGIYHNGLMFGLVVGDTLCLKADAENADHFEKEGLGRFDYNSGETVVKMSYYRAPAGIMEDREKAAMWARRSFEAAFRSQRSKKKTKRNSLGSGGTIHSKEPPPSQSREKHFQINARPKNSSYPNIARGPNPRYVARHGRRFREKIVL